MTYTSNALPPRLQSPNRRRAPIGALFRLMRLHRPVGIWLLLWPCWWSVSLSHHGTDREHLFLLGLFALGAIAMRSAGCVVNDLADRRFDRQVARTRSRPLASGELTSYQAVMALVWLLSLALLVVMQLRTELLVWAILSLALVATYPFMKRITYWPQAFLGLTFNLGALFGWVATSGSPSVTAWLLYAAGICWTIGYDTLYAHQDIEDDVRIGVKSTAIRFGRHSRWITLLFYMFSAALLWLALASYHPVIAYGPPLLMAAFGLALCLGTRLENPSSCLRAFKANVLLGGLIWGCFLISN